MTLTTVLECRRLTFGYPTARRHAAAVPLLTNIDAVFPGGRIMLVSGHSGVGKSTLLHLLAGLLRPNQGEVRADGQSVSRWIAAHRDRWRRRVGILFQRDHLIGGLTALENVIMPLIPRNGGPRQWRQLGMEMLAEFKMDDLAGQPVRSLSGGQRQRVAAARALVGIPDYIVADEPAAHQDLENARGLGRLLRQAADRGAVVVVAAHDRHVDEWIAVDGHLVLENGMLHPAS